MLFRSCLSSIFTMLFLRKSFGAFTINAFFIFYTPLFFSFCHMNFTENKTVDKNLRIDLKSIRLISKIGSFSIKDELVDLTYSYSSSYFI
jgi:hypothetical protein